MGSSLAVFSATGISLHAEEPAPDTTSCKECQHLATGFVSWAPAFKFSFVEACSLSQGVAFISSRRGLQSQEIFIYFFFQKTAVCWKLDFSYKSCSSAISNGTDQTEVASLLIFLEGLNFSKLPSVHPAVYTVAAVFPPVRSVFLTTHEQLRASISC